MQNGSTAFRVLCSDTEIIFKKRELIEEVQRKAAKVLVSKI